MSGPSAESVAELERADRLEEAATLASELGLHAEATRLWERACHYDRASEAALALGDPARAMELAARAGNVEQEQRVAAALAREPELAARTADTLVDLGRPASAGRLRLALGDLAGAAEAFERAAAWLDAASARDRAGDPRRAARCLETAIDVDPGNHRARLELGALLLRHGRHEAAARALQPIPESAAERAAALPLLGEAFHELGLGEAERAVEQELVSRGVAATAARLAVAATASDDASAQVLFGRYRVQSEVARTPTARVLAASDQITGERVAVKLFSAATLRDAGRDALKRFEREAVILGQLRHPSIVPLVAYLPEGPAVVLRWMGGGSLADALGRGTISPARAVEIACAVLGALAEAHRRGILHRDIKPANVLFDDSGAAFLADFGTAHVSDAAATVTSGVIGTLAYMAPEQRSGHAANPKSDVYGVGALLVHALTGAPPDAKLDFLSSELGPRHHEVVARLVAPEAERPESALDARQLLRSLAWPEAVPAPRPALAGSERPPASVRSVRLEPLGGGRYRDRVLGREILVLEATGNLLERALAFARADQPSLASVLVLERDSGALWVEAVTGEPPVGALDADELEHVARALGALHRAGGYHGAVDREHLVRRGGELVLRFPLEPKTEGAAADLAALAALG